MVIVGCRPAPIRFFLSRSSAALLQRGAENETFDIKCTRRPNITHTVRYTERSPERFKGFWKD
jgi:hypothetical protein